MKQHVIRTNFRTAFAACAAGLVLAACGSADKSAGDTLACVMEDGGQAACTEFAEFKSADMRLAAGTNCRQSGGSTAKACPAQDLAGMCETRSEAKQPWEYSRLSRHAVYRGGRQDPQRAQAECTANAGSRWVPAQ